VSAYRSAYPSSSLGYWRGTAEGISGPSLGGTVAANGTMGTSAGTGAVTIGQTAWHPSVLYLLGLVIAEMIVFGWMGRILK
jgi:hypothetical protein